MQLPSHILILRLSAMGDVAMVVPVLLILVNSYPNLKITVISRKQYQSLFQNIENVTFLEADVYGQHKGFGLLRLANRAKISGIEAVADLHNVLRSRILSNYLKLKGVKVATLDKGRAEKKGLTKAKNKIFKPLKTTQQRYADVFGKLGYRISFENSIFLTKASLPPKLNALLGVEPKKIIGIAPYAAYASKMYPKHLMAEIIRELEKKHRIFLFGGGKKEELELSQLANQYSNISSVAGKFSFEEELALISNLDCMLAMDSGNGHLAAMYGVPVITLWGVTHPFAGFAPFGQPESNQLVADRKKFPLIPTSVFGNTYPKGYEDVMETISPETILSKIKTIFS